MTIKVMRVIHCYTPLSLANWHSYWSHGHWNSEFSHEKWWIVPVCHANAYQRINHQVSPNFIPFKFHFRGFSYGFPTANQSPSHQYEVMRPLYLRATPRCHATWCHHSTTGAHQRQEQRNTFRCGTRLTRKNQRFFPSENRTWLESHAIFIWLVVDQPLWKIWVRQLGGLIPIYGEKKCLKPPTSYVLEESNTLLNYRTSLN